MSPVVFHFTTGIYYYDMHSTHRAGECSTCSSIGGYCMTPLGSPSPYCYDLPYPQCVIDSTSLSGGFVPKLYKRNESNCGGVLVGEANVAFIDYGSTTFSSTAVSQGFLPALYASDIWAAPLTYGLHQQCQTGSFPTTLGNVTRFGITGTPFGTALNSTSIDLIVAHAFSSFPSLLVSLVAAVVITQCSNSCHASLCPSLAPLV